ncbi:MAG: pyridoxamine 5'-phosphate oxidase family protein [Spirochaetia bacterium]
MTFKELLSKLEDSLDDSKVAIFATVDTEGKPHMRWLTPTYLKGKNGFIYALTSPEFSKVEHIEKNPNVQWLVQNRALNKIMTASGEARIIDNPSFKTEVIEGIGRNLDIFWRVNPNEQDLVIIETKLTDIHLHQPIDDVSERAGRES